MVHLCAGNNVTVKAEVMNVTAGCSVPVQVITTSICRMTSLSLTTLKPSMLGGNTQRFFFFVTVTQKQSQQLPRDDHKTPFFGITANPMHNTETKVQPGAYV